MIMVALDRCEKCGSEIEFIRHVSTEGWYCKNCDWSIVTTYIPQIVLDKENYMVYLTSPNYRNREQISIVSKISNLNYLTVRELLREEKPLIFKGEASKVLIVKEQLASEGISFEIVPEFNY